MKKILVSTVMVMAIVALVSCGSNKSSVASNRMFDDNSLKIVKAAETTNSYNIIVGKERIQPYTISDRKRLKGLTLKEAQEKVLQEAVIARGCAMIVEPNYSYDMKGKRVVRITVVGYPGYYNFDKDKKNEN
jgi:hypothetical protein